MTPVHVHLLLNHVPILGTLIGVVLLAIGALRKNEELRWAHPARGAAAGSAGNPEGIEAEAR